MKTVIDGLAITPLRGFIVTGLLVLVLLVNGCTNSTKPIQFYRLTADVDVTNTAHANKVDQGPVIGLGPIRIPDYLNRPQIMVAVTPNQYLLSDDHRWAERLDQNISLALYQVLPSQLNTDRLVRYPWSQRQVIDYQVGMDIVAFNVDAAGQARLIVQWFVKHKDNTILDKRSEYQFPGSSTDYAVVVKAQSQCLTQLGLEISQTLRQLMVVDVDQGIAPK
ncbi:MAG: PqiC family protein [Methylococcales bacterium]